MKTFNLRILLVLFFVGVGELWGQNCGTGMTITRIDDSSPVTVAGTSTTGSVSICVGELNRYRFTITGVTGAIITYTYGSSIVQSGTACPTGDACGTSTLEFYLSPLTTLGQPLTATVVGTSPACSLVYTITLNPAAVMPSFSIQNSNNTHSTAVVGSGGSRTSNSIACENSTVNLTATCTPGGSTFCNSYVWSSGSTTSPLVVSLSTSNHVVTLTATSIDGCKIQDVHTVNVKSKPTLSSITVSNVCVGNPATSSVTATNFSSINTSGATVSYSWSTSGPSSQSVTNSTNVLTDSWTTSGITPTGTYLMSVSATAQYTQSSNNISCISIPQTSNFTVNPNPSITVTVSSSATICSGQSVTLTASGGVNYLWNTTAATTAAITRLPSSSIVYSVTGTSASGCIGTSSQSITVNSVIALSPKISLSGQTATLPSACVGNNIDVTFTNDFSSQTAPNLNSPSKWSWGTSPGASISTTTSITNFTLSSAGSFTWSGTYTNNNNCISSFSTSLTVNSNPVVSITGPSTQQCSGTTVTLTATNGSVAWAPSNITNWELDNATILSTSSTNPYSPALTNNTGGVLSSTYSVLIRDGNGCITEGTKIISIGPSFSADLNPTSSACRNQNITIQPNVTGGLQPYTYTWSPPSAPALQVNTYAGGALTINDFGNANPYPSTVNVTGLSGTISNIRVTITNFNHAFPSDVDMVLFGPTGAHSIIFTNAIGGSGGVVSRNYTFQIGSVALPLTGFPASGTYGVVNGAAYNGTGTPSAVNSANLNNFVGTNPNGDWRLYVYDDLAGDVGTIGSWSIELTTAPAGASCSGSSCDYANIPIGTYNFSATITDASSSGCSQVVSQVLTVADCGSVTIQPNYNTSSNNHVCLGDFVSLTALCSGCTQSPLIYSWSSGSTSPTLSFPVTSSLPENIVLAVTVGYYATTTNGNEYTPIDNAEISITVSKPSLEIVNDTSVCEGSPFNLIASCPGCATNLKYSWKELNSNSAITTITGVTSTGTISLGSVATVTNDLNYRITVTDIYECKSIENVYLSNITLPSTVIDQGATARYCPTSSVALTTTTANCQNCTYSWSTSQVSPNISVNQDNVYRVTTTNNGCSEVDAVTVTKYSLPAPIIENSVGTALSNQASPNNVLYICGNPANLVVDSASCVRCGFNWNTGATTPAITVTGNGGYFVQAVDTNGCIGYSGPVFAISSTTGQNSVASANTSSICNSNPAVLNIDPCSGCTYAWYSTASPTTILGNDRTFSTTVSGNYFARTTNFNGCVYNSNIVNISAISVTRPSFTLSADTICNATGTIPASTSLLTTNSGVGFSYQWYKDGLAVSAATDSSFMTNLSGIYYVGVTYPNGCTEYSLPDTIVSVNFTPIINTPSSTVICGDESINLSTSALPGYTYQWYYNGNLISAAQNSSYSANLQGSYVVMVTNNFGCSRATSSVSLTRSSNVQNVDAYPNFTEICPGETANLQVTLCPNCFYQWFDASTGSNLTASLTTNYQFPVTSSGRYYARTNDGSCLSNSDTIQVVSLPVITPSINTNANIVCNGVTPRIFTQSCNSCTYTWKRNGSIIFGALNDTFLIVSDVSDAGVYALEITYPNGCTGISNSITITDGSYPLNISVADNIICNSDNELISSVASLPAVCNLGCSYQWLRNNIAISGSNFPNFTANSGGNYKLVMIDSRGCSEESNVIPLTAIDLIPSITSTSTAICGNDAIRLSYPDSASCLGCVYEWQKGGSAAAFGTNTNPFYVTDMGANAVGVYSLEVTQSGCTALSNLISLNQISGLSIPVASTDQNICNGDTTTIYRVGGGCVDCQFQWLLDSLPILAATTPSLTVSNPGNYNLQMSIGATGCRDTSAVITLLPVQSPIDSFNLETVFYSPLTSTGPSLNLQNAVFPSSVALASVNDAFSSQPFNAAFAANSGLSGPRNDTLNPGDAGPGFHRIYYQFDTLGCSFVYNDILLVFGEPSVSITNENNNAPQFEACVADTIQLSVFNMPFQIANVYLFNENNTYFSVPINSSNLTPTIYGGATVYNGTIRLGIPDNAYSSFMLVTSAGNLDSFVTPFLLIHNTNLDISGLPGVVCSANPPLALTGTPAGGFFTAQYFSGGTLAQGAAVSGAFAGNNFNTGAMTRASYGNDMLQTVRVVYNYFNSFTNGIGCPQVDTISQFVEARGVFLDAVKFNPISVSQDRELLSNLVFRVTPYQSQPSWIRQNYNNGDVSFSGNFTFPAGNPVDFLPKNAGVGKHAMTYRISNGSCTNQITDSIQVIAAPSPIGIPDSMCRNQTFADFYRHTIYSQRDSSYSIALGINYKDTTNIISVYTTNGPNAGLTAFPSSLNLERYNYNPAPVPGNTDTLKMEYWYKKVERINGVPVDTIMYIVGSIVTPIFIENPFTVEIIDTIVNSQYCEEDELYLLAGSCPNPPCRGIFTLQGGTGAYATGAILLNNILNPYDVHSPENSTTLYNLTYTVTGAVCQNSDTKQITIPEPIDPAFSTVSGKRIFCHRDPTENIVISATGNFTGQWLINGITQQPSYTFSPLVLNPGNQVVTNIITDNQYGCVYTATNIYLVNPLPTITVNPLLNAEYCTNDSIVNLVVTPDPVCPVLVPQSLLFEGFESLTFPWNRESTGAGNPWIRSTSLPFSGVSSAMVTTSNDVQNAWMFSPNINMVTGQSYRITVFASAGNCSTPGCLPAALRVRLSQGQSILTHSTPTTVLVADTTISQTFYQPYSFNYTHSGLPGNYNFSMHCYSGIGARSLFVDNITIANDSVQTCASGGLGIMNGPGVAFAGNSTYTFNPQIVAPGNHTISYVYTDAATGCTNSIPMPVLVKQHVIPTFTNLNPQYCDNASPVQLIGTPPNGTFSSNGPNLLGSAYDPSVGFQNEIVRYNYLDLQTGCRTIVSDTVTVVSIADSARITGVNASGYCYNVDSILLNISSVFGNPDTVLAGDFYGFGVRKGLQGPGIATFYPDSAVLDAGRYGEFVITYVYPTLSGCFDTTKVTTFVHAMPDLSFDLVPANRRLPDSICLNAGVDTILVNNHVITGNLGQIVIDSLLPVGLFLGGTYTPSLGAQDTLNPLNFGVGWHNISFSYTDANGCSAVISDSFRVDTVPNIYFTGLQADRIYCENEAPSLLLAYPPYYPGSGYLQLTSDLDSITVDSSFYLINPANLVSPIQSASRTWQIYYTFEDLNFCSNFARDSFKVNPYPRITMTLPSVICSGPALEPLSDNVNPPAGIFTDNLVISDIVQDSFLNLQGTIGPRLITYFYTNDTTTCSNRDTQTVTVFSTPDFDFNALGGCVGATITFVSDTNNLDLNVDAITRIEWIFGDGNNFVNNSPPDSLVPNQTHVYANDSIYQVSLIVRNQGLCEDTVTRQLVISPFINTYPYIETFQTGTAGWYQEEPIIVADTLAVWQRAELIGNNINDPANFAWVTKANAPFTYNTNERGWVYSPCFDFDTLLRPMIAFDIWRDFLTDIDGAVLEFYDDYSNTWNPVGETEKGINWYQTNYLVSRPGNQAAASNPRGWTGESAGWEKARYRLDYLTGRPYLRFRVAFASDPNTVLEGHEGMAFDSVWIGDRGRNVLVEHFSNFFHFNQQGASMDIIDKKVYDTIYNSTNGRDVSLIQYQTNIQQVDPVNALFSFDFDSRVLYYGINANSQIRIDGLTYGNGRSETLSQYQMDFDMLQFPAFDIRVDPLIFSGNTIQVNAEARALTNLDSSDYTMTFAITEDDLFNSRGFAMQSVLRKFIPDASGFPLQQGWTAGQIVNRSGSWIYNFGTPDPSKIEAVIFIQNNNTKDVMQVATTRDLSIFPPVGSIPVEEEAAVRRDIIGMNLFPNPAQNYFNVSFDLPLSDDYQWALVDVLGRVLENGIARENTEQMIIDTEKLSEGTYFFTIRNDHAYAQRKVVIRKK